MRKALLFISLFLPIVCGITAGQQGPRDTIPKKVKAEAVKRTNNQIDSVYSNIPPYIDALRNDFRVLRSHMDTMNAQSIIREQAYEKAAIERDKAVQDRLIVIHQNTQLRMENAHLTKQNDFMINIPHYLMIFAVCFAAVIVAYGVIKTIPKIKKDEM